MIGLDDVDDDIYLYSLKGLISLIPYLIPKSKNDEALEEKDEILKRVLRNEESKKESRSILNSILRNPMKGSSKKSNELLQPALSAVENIVIPHILKLCVAEDEKSSQKWQVLDDFIWLWKKLSVEFSKVTY